MFRRVLIIALALGVTAGFIGLGSALFTSTASVDANAFTTGTVIISTNPTTAAVTFSNMAPADQVTAPITVTNGGSLDLRYAVSSIATDDDSKNLNGQLVLTIKTGVTTCTTGGFAADGTQVYTGVLGTTPLATKLIGDSTTEPYTGTVRTLPPTTGNSEVLCFNVTLPSTSGNTFQGATTTATFTFDAEQVKNNP